MGKLTKTELLRRYNAGGYSRNGTADPYAGRSTGKGIRPAEKLPVLTPDFSFSDSSEFSVTWFGHSSVLLRISGTSILLDPVFSEFATPVIPFGPKRFSRPSVRIKDLPHIDVCITTHDHYDHLDRRCIRALRSRTDVFLGPQGVGELLTVFGAPAEKVRSFAWWQEEIIKGIRFICVPSFHNSGRYPFRMNSTFWSSWIIDDGKRKLYICGDSGFSSHFEAIHKVYGDMDFALMDTSQYSVNWPGCHMFPEDSVKAAKILGTKLAMPYHYGAFVLSGHAWDDPPERFTLRADEEGLAWMAPRLCETADITCPEKYQSRWWREIK